VIHGGDILQNVNHVSSLLQDPREALLQPGRAVYIGAGVVKVQENDEKRGYFLYHDHPSLAEGPQEAFYLSKSEADKRSDFDQFYMVDCCSTIDHGRPFSVISVEVGKVDLIHRLDLLVVVGVEEVRAVCGMNVVDRWEVIGERGSRSSTRADTDLAR